MAREYTITGANQGPIGAITLIGIRPPVSLAIEILRVWVGQSANSASVQQRVQLVRQAATLPSVATVTPAKTKEGDPTSGIVGGTALAAGTCGITATAEGGGTRTVIAEDTFNVLNGWLWVPTPKETIILAPSSALSFGLYFPVAPATTTGWTFGLTFSEIG